MNSWEEEAIPERCPWYRLPCGNPDSATAERETVAELAATLRLLRAGQVEGQ